MGEVLRQIASHGWPFGIGNLLDETMVSGERKEGQGSQQIGTGVTDVGHVKLATRDQTGDTGGPHRTPHFFRFLEDNGIGFPQGLREAFLRLIRGFPKAFLDRVERHDRRAITIIVSAHPIGHREQVAERNTHFDQSILVFLTLPAYIGMKTHEDLEARRR